MHKMICSKPKTHLGNKGSLSELWSVYLWKQRERSFTLFKNTYLKGKIIVLFFGIWGRIFWWFIGNKTKLSHTFLNDFMALPSLNYGYLKKIKLKYAHLRNFISCDHFNITKASKYMWLFIWSLSTKEWFLDLFVPSILEGPWILFICSISCVAANICRFLIP